MTNFIAITDNSVWLVERSDFTGALTVIDRATFGSPYIEDGRRFHGPVTFGELKPGSRLQFVNTFEDPRGRKDQPVATGVINRVVQHADTPKAEESVSTDGIRFIRLVPSWSFLLPFVQGGQEVMANARRAFRSADLLSILVDMGRVTQQDLLDADARGL